MAKELLTVAILARRLTVAEVVRIAMDLKSEDGENPEYDRALVEVVIDAAGLDMSDKPGVAKELGIDLSAGSTYAIYWYEGNVRKEAHYAAPSLHDALVMWFIAHPAKSYSDIAEHLEVG